MFINPETSYLLPSHRSFLCNVFAVRPGTISFWFTQHNQYLEQEIFRINSRLIIVTNLCFCSRWSRDEFRLPSLSKKEKGRGPERPSQLQFLGEITRFQIAAHAERSTKTCKASPWGFSRVALISAHVWGLETNCLPGLEGTVSARTMRVPTSQTGETRNSWGTG